MLANGGCTVLTQSLHHYLNWGQLAAGFIKQNLSSGSFLGVERKFVVKTKSPAILTSTRAKTKQSKKSASLLKNKLAAERA